MRKNPKIHRSRASKNSHVQKIPNLKFDSNNAAVLTVSLLIFYAKNMDVEGAIEHGKHPGS